jgi:IS30 family transposase
MSHLSLADRSEIENGLRHGDSFNAIASHLKVARSTVMREVKKHAQKSDKGAKGRVTNRCIHRSQCDKHFLCGTCVRPLQNRKCSSCHRCNDVCPDFEEKKCEKLDKPPYVCNGCTGESSCVLRKKFYIAAVAQKAYEELLTAAREGAAVTDAERREMTDTLAAGFKKGQSLHHIVQASPDLFHVSERTLYQYVNSGLLKPVGRCDLPMAVKMKPRRRKGVAHKVDRKCREGRTLDDFETFMAMHPGLDVVEMDSVEGEKGGKLLLTLNFNICSFLMAFVREANTSQSVIDIFNVLEKTFGLALFRKLFPVIITDNGSEFSNPAALEASLRDGERRTNIFYCKPMAAWQKPNVENNHRNLRTIFPKGESMDHVTQEKVALAMSHLNSKLREGLDDIQAIKLFETIYGKDILGKLGVRLIAPQDVNLTPELVK